MARSKGVNKSQSIRDYLTANPDAAAKEVVSELGKTGLKVSENLVYGIKGQMKEKKQRKKRVAKAAMAASTKAASNGTPSKSEAVALIHDVRALANRAGGYESLVELVKALAE